MFSAKKIPPNTVLKTVYLAKGATVNVSSPGSVTWAVVEDGRVFFVPHMISGEMHPSLWPAKHIAEKEAEFYNSKIMATS